MTKPELRLIGAAAAEKPVEMPPVTPQAVPRLLWGWKEVEEATGIPKRTLLKAISAGGFPKPGRLGNRRYWAPAVVTSWCDDLGQGRRMPRRKDG